MKEGDRMTSPSPTARMTSCGHTKGSGKLGLSQRLRKKGENIRFSVQKIRRTMDTNVLKWTMDRNFYKVVSKLIHLFVDTNFFLDRNFCVFVHFPKGI